MLKCRLIDPATVDQRMLDGFADRTIFQTREWLSFVAETQKARPLLVELRDGTEIAGYFTGLLVQRFGLKILGSSFPGWTTPYMGFNLAPGVTRSTALEAIEGLAFGTLKCAHMEISDPHFTVEDGARLGFVCGEYVSYATDLRQSEEAIFQSMESACRRCIRKAEKSGVVLEQAHDIEFADEFYTQLIEVFAKQNKTPTYDRERVRALIRHLDPTGRLLLVRARDPQGNCIATGIFPGFRKVAQFWGNASLRSGQILRPNEAIQWYAMRYWRERGVELYDWGGGGSYKEKYGCTPYSVPWFSKSRFQVIRLLRDGARQMFETRQRILGRMRATRGPEPAEESAPTR
ncbi:MAG: GNAT family N-acetyltransferase [Bryobacteraceae bacterium]